MAAGGGLLGPDGNVKLDRYILDACGKARPRVCFVPTASGEDIGYCYRFYDTYAKFGLELDILRFFRRTPADLRDYLFAFDVVHVGGGNTRSMLAVWRHWGFDDVLREAWDRGIVLCGSSAGSICWFGSGVTDSVADALHPMDCMGFLPGSHCPHYDGEPERRPSYQRFVATGEIAPGVACDDGAAMHYVGDELPRPVSARPAARAYNVERVDGAAVETPLDMTFL